MHPLNPEVLLREVGLLGKDLERLLPQLRQQAQALKTGDFERILLVGSGDALFAGMSTMSAVREFSRRECRALSPFELMAYSDSLGPDRLVVLSSASGNTPRILEAAAYARGRGAKIVGVSSNPDGALLKYADYALTSHLPDKEPCPGVRSYQAILLSHFVLALALGEAKGNSGETCFEEIANLASAIDASYSAVRKSLEEMAKQTADSPHWVIASGGPHRGTALYAAAKFMEALGQPASGQDIDEWWHIERHLLPISAPLILIAPPGAAGDHAVEIAKVAADLHRSVFVVADWRESRFSHHAVLLIGMRGTPRESFAPLLYYIFAPILAGFIARARGTKLFPARALNLYATDTRKSQ
ncbi:hypothetical protein CDG76_35170 [Nostoc sp. 'Peltigera membranacea cyanobiont' 210A]|uniref:SIS domain-containing protein n=1 Tax=Nostoc sp. 'Peltigera membranacea cyanobiont' 210A TaxID=2014529 RepID=UPI000B958A3F|nr:SIS domain-containing protein [Nostoc sp. 'Peltigera membranacea cyanobiont' 210A]OYD89387.1 hypothetical protein CDG76_35170 [Nostoc sp. 'Peltigera membranacea cyanobiont' 210A]